MKKFEESCVKVSIVMPSFNQVNFIEKSILSVINQDHQNIQLIIIDGGSTDGTVDIIKKYKDYIYYWVSEEDLGQSDALNKGFHMADGEIFGWLNSDDLYLPNAFKSAVAAFERQPEKTVVFGDWLSIDSVDRTCDFSYAFDFNFNHLKYEGFHLNAQAMFWRSGLHQKFGSFDIELYYTMDYQMMVAFGAIDGAKGFLRIPTPLGAFRRYEGQKTAGMNSDVLLEHMNISKAYFYTNKYGKFGKLRRLPYRFRRAFWYLKRGGYRELVKRLILTIAKL